MGTGTVVVVESDDWVARLLHTGFSDAGYDVTVAGEAIAGVQQTHERKPDCVVCATKLPDFDGAWVVGQLRASASRVAETPFLLLSGAEPDDVVEAGFQAGADAAIGKPFRVREVVAQVNALVSMAARLRRSSEREAPPLLSLRPSLFPTEALRGSLAQMSLAMVLALLEMERRSGRLRISRDGAEAAIDLASGFATSASISGQPTPLVPALRQLLGWRTGVVSFVVGSKLAPPPGAQPMPSLLMQAMQAPPPPASKPPPSTPVARAEDAPVPRPSLSASAKPPRLPRPAVTPNGAPTPDSRSKPPPLPGARTARDTAARDTAARDTPAGGTNPAIPRPPRLPMVVTSDAARPATSTSPRVATASSPHQDIARPRPRSQPHRSAHGMLTPPPLAPPRVQPK